MPFRLPVSLGMDFCPLPFAVDGSVSNVIHVNARVMIREEGDVRVVFVAGIPLLRYERADEAGRALVMVTLVQDGYASVTEVASKLTLSS